MNFSKKMLLFGLCPMIVMGALTGCKAALLTATDPLTDSVSDTAAPTETSEEESSKEEKSLKILTLGSSSTVDACHLLNQILATEGTGDYEEVIVGTLYYSGCKLSQHVQFLSQNSPKYSLYLSSSATPNSPPKITKNMTMEMALKLKYWDVILLQASGGELDEDQFLTNGNVRIIQNYVNKKKTNPSAYFGWHFTCIPPTDPELMDSYPYSPNPYRTKYELYNFDRVACFQARAERIRRYVFTNETIPLKICSITAVMNACTSYLEEKDLYRDYTHSSDLGRVMTSYVWYCRLMGKERLEEIRLDAIPKQFLKSTQDKTKDRILTEEEKAIILESVNNALAHPLEVTQSQYVSAPSKK